MPICSLLFIAIDKRRNIQLILSFDGSNIDDIDQTLLKILRRLLCNSTLSDVEEVVKHVKGVINQFDPSLGYTVDKENNHSAETTWVTLLQNPNPECTYIIKLDETKTTHSEQFRWDMTCHTRLRILRYTS